MLGPVVEGWTPRERPARVKLHGNLVRIEPLDPDQHAAAMHAAHHGGDPDGKLWDYLPYGPFDTLAAYKTHLAMQASSEDPLFFSIIELASGDAVGVASIMRHDADNGAAEVGHICYTPRLQQQVGATEAMYLFACYIFDDLGYRRYEWKCNNGNGASKRAAQRLGFTFEGVFRQHLVTKGRNRDTAWFSIIDGEWPEIKERFERWLSPDNFDADGKQRLALNPM